MVDDYPSRVVLCPPANRDQLGKINAVLPTPFKPTVEHTLSTCDSCTGSIWIAQQQLDLVKSPFMKTCKLCMLCMTEVHKVLSPLRVEEINLDRGIAFALKR